MDTVFIIKYIILLEQRVHLFYSIQQRTNRFDLSKSMMLEFPLLLS